jgi:signal transduction histidine kinase/ActR/RegA family two-component response regulator
MFYHNEEDRASARALEANRQTATAVQVTLNRSFSVLAAVAQSPLLDGDDLGPFSSLLERILPLMPNWHSLLLTTPDGRLASRVAPRPGASLSQPLEPESFVRVVADTRPTVGQLAKGPSGVWAIPLRVPVMRDGKVRYVLTAPMLPDSVAEILALLKLPKAWTVVIVDANGRRIARSPSGSLGVGSQVSAQLAALALSSGDEGSGVTYTNDGQEVYTAYLRLPEVGWTVVTGIPTAEFKTSVTKAVALYAGGLGISLLLTCLSALYCARRISSAMQQLRNAAVTVGQGAISSLPNTRIPEIQEVAKALHQAAEGLQISEQARSDALASLASANRSLVDAARRKDEFIATIAHELRTPLTPLLQAAALFRGDPSVSSKGHLRLQVIERNVAELSRLLEGLFDASRLNLRQIVLHKEPLELCTLIRETIGSIAARALEKRIEIKSDFPEVPLYINGDGLRLRQVLFSLLDNAVKYTPAAGRINLTVRHTDAQVDVQVIDNGVGIASENMDVIFDMFGRVSGPGLDGGGLGVGLTLARTLAELHDGTLHGGSPGLGKGSCFTVSLPLALNVLRPALSVVSATTHATTARTVVVADDNVDIADTLRAILEMEGHQVRLAFDGLQALALCQEQMPDVAILDIGMPNLNGHLAARAIRVLPDGDKVFLVALSGWGQPNDIRETSKSGFDKHITKPANLEDLLCLVAQAKRHT